MKNHILITAMIFCFAFAKAQTAPTKQTAQTQNNLPAEGHLLDQQAEVLGQIFGDIGGVEEMKEIDGFMDLVRKSDASPDLKAKLKEQYQLLTLADDPIKKKEQQIALTKMLKKALEESKPNKK